MGDGHVPINDGLEIPRGELNYRATRSGGPGGQHVNTSSTRVELTWDVANSPSLNEEQRSRLLEKLGKRIDSEGVLHLVSSAERSQSQNREDVTERFRRIVAAALKVPKRRKKTRPPRAAKETRLREKKQRSETKSRRGRVEEDGE